MNERPSDGRRDPASDADRSEHDDGRPADVRRFDRSEAWLERAQRTIPLGAQTFSKSRTQFPYGASPFFIERSEGAYCWDIDGNRYLDLINGLLAVSLGHRDPAVEAAVRRQLESGVTHSLSHRLECEVAERICAMVPCAERVRFGKNGSDATTAAIRLARAFTGRERVALCGYHGWQDWSIGTTTRDLGVPQAVQSLSDTFVYNDLDSLRERLEASPGTFAAVIVEPMAARYPVDGFLQGVCDLAGEHDALSVFDETITGFRFARGGAQELFGVTPDLATLGKGMANGFPLSAVVGRADVMAWMERIFFSTTFGGETLSLAAATAVLDRLQNEPVLEEIAATGGALADGLRTRITQHGLSSRLEVDGHPSWSFLLISEPAPVTDGSGAADPGLPGPSSWELRTLVLQELIARGVLTLGTHNISAAHGPDEVTAVLAAYDEVLPQVARAVDAGTCDGLLRCEPLEPLFRLR